MHPQHTARGHDVGRSRRLQLDVISWRSLPMIQGIPSLRSSLVCRLLPVWGNDILHMNVWRLITVLQCEYWCSNVKEDGLTSSPGFPGGPSGPLWPAEPWNAQLDSKHPASARLSQWTNYIRDKPTHLCVFDSKGRHTIWPGSPTSPGGPWIPEWPLEEWGETIQSMFLS